MKTLNMNLISYLNLFEKITSIRCKSCFIYNQTIIFAVPYSQVSKAVGISGRNVKKLSEILGRRIKVVSLPRDTRDVFSFVSSIVSPLEIKKIEINGEEAVITSTNGNKAVLIGRKKARLEEIEEIMQQYFNLKSVRIA